MCRVRSVEPPFKFRPISTGFRAAAAPTHFEPGAIPVVLFGAVLVVELFELVMFQATIPSTTIAVSPAITHDFKRLS